MIHLHLQLLFKESTVALNDKLPSSTVFGMTGDIDPTDPVKESPVGIIIFVLTIVTEPIEKEEDTPVNETVSSARFPHSPSFHAFAPHPVASKASRFQYACPQVNRPHPD